MGSTGISGPVVRWHGVHVAQGLGARELGGTELSGVRLRWQWVRLHWGKTVAWGLVVPGIGTGLRQHGGKVAQGKMVRGYVARG